MEKQIATRSSSSNEEQSRSVAHQSPMCPESLKPPSWEHHAEPTPTPPVSPDHNAFTSPHRHSSVTPEPSPPPRLRCGGRYDRELTHAPKDVSSPLTDIGDNDNEDNHTGAVQKGSHTHRKAKVPQQVPAASNEDPAKKRGKKP